MSKKRTKKDKIRSQQRKIVTTPSKFVEKTGLIIATDKSVDAEKQIQSLFAYPLKLIKQDLLKTVLVTSIVLILLTLLAIYR